MKTNLVDGETPGGGGGSVPPKPPYNPEPVSKWEKYKVPAIVAGIVLFLVVVAKCSA